MPKFTYEGETKDRVAVTETVEAKDRFEVYEIARKEGHTVNSVTEAQGLSLRNFINVEKIEYYISRVSTDELVMVTRNLGSMIRAGLPISRALSVIERQTKNPRLKLTVKDIRDQISKGTPVNEALEKFPNVFNELYIAMVRAGEESGQLAESLHTLSTQMERASTLRKKIVGAMIYPSIVVVVMIIIGVLMMIYVMPSITNTFKKLEVDLPATTQALIAASDFFNANILLSLGAIVGVVVGFMYSLRTRIGKKIYAWITVRLPVIGTIAKEANAARTTRTLSSLLSAGVSVIKAIEITEEVVQNVYYKRILKEVATEVEKGNPMSSVFTKNDFLYPVLVGEMILVGEETGQIAEMMKQLAEFYEGEVDQKTKDLSTIVEPILMVVIGGTVGFFALAMIAPIYSISDSIG